MEWISGWRQAGRGHVVAPWLAKPSQPSVAHLGGASGHWFARMGSSPPASCAHSANTWLSMLPLPPAGRSTDQPPGLPAACSAVGLGRPRGASEGKERGSNPMYSSRSPSQACGGGLTCQWVVRVGGELASASQRRKQGWLPNRGAPRTHAKGGHLEPHLDGPAQRGAQRGRGLGAAACRQLVSLLCGARGIGVPAARGRQGRGVVGEVKGCGGAEWLSVHAAPRPRHGHSCPALPSHHGPPCTHLIRSPSFGVMRSRCACFGLAPPLRPLPCCCCWSSAAAEAGRPDCRARRGCCCLLDSSCLGLGCCSCCFLLSSCCGSALGVGGARLAAAGGSAGASTALLLSRMPLRRSACWRSSSCTAVCTLNVASGPSCKPPARREGGGATVPAAAGAAGLLARRRRRGAVARLRVSEGGRR